jgi:hypothetical protein
MCFEGLEPLVNALIRLNNLGHDRSVVNERRLQLRLEDGGSNDSGAKRG